MGVEQGELDEIDDTAECGLRSRRRGSRPLLWEWTRCAVGALVALIPVLLLGVAAAAGQQVVSPGKVERDVSVPRLDGPREACAVLDGAAASYAGRTDGDMTLWSGRRPVAFTLTINSPQESGAAPAEIANFQTDARGTEFDLQMPRRSYSSVRLEFARHDLATVAVVSAGNVPVGRFVLFDLTANKLAADTTLRLGERLDPVLHVRLDKAMARGDLWGAWVPPARSEATVFTTVASGPVVTRAAERTVDQSSAQGTASVAEFVVPQGVPVERVVVNVGPEAEDYHRTVLVTAGEAAGKAQEAARVTGTIQRMHDIRENLPLRVDDRAVDAVLLNNQRSPMRVRVTIENGVGPPLPIIDVQLQMRERKICFPAWPGAERWRLYYGEPTVRFISLGGGHQRSLVLASDPVTATLGPENVAAEFHPLTVTNEGTPWRLLAAMVVFVVLVCVFLALFLRTAKIPHIKR